jgi:hypothetical protein
MNTQTGDLGPAGGSRLERAIVLQLLRDDHGQQWSREELSAEIAAEPAALELALSRLAADGILCTQAANVSASTAARRMDELGLIGI